MKKISYLSNKRSMKMPYTESVGTERHNLRKMVADGFKRESKVGIYRYVPSFRYRNGWKENVDTNVTVTKNIRKCYFALTCCFRNPGGLREQQQWNSNRFLLAHSRAYQQRRI